MRGFGAAGWVAALLISFLVHELGHALTARRYFGAKPEITLGIGRSPSGASVFGGVKVFEKEDYYIFLSEKRAARAEKPKKNAQTMSKKLQRL